MFEILNFVQNITNHLKSKHRKISGVSRNYKRG
jgi:hypothetical protein